MQKIMLDTNIYDKIITTSGMTERLNQLSKDGKITILCTHIQEDELANIPNEQKRKLIEEIIKIKVPTNGMVWDVSRWDEATFGNGSSIGFGIDDIRSPSKNHTGDSLIATTAARDAEIFVTDDIRLTNRMQAVQASCEIYGFDKFKEQFLH